MAWLDDRNPVDTGRKKGYQPDYEGIEKTKDARVLIAWDIENVQSPLTYNAINRTLTALKEAFSLGNQRTIDEIVIVHKDFTDAVRSLSVLRVAGAASSSAMPQAGTAPVT